MRFAIFDHAGKSAYLRQQLLAAGHTQAERIDETDVLLLDCDWHWAHPRPAMIDAAIAAGARVALYPHGGMPTVFAYDGLAEPHAGVSLRLEHGPGSIDIARLFGAESRLSQHAPGWLYTPTAAFSPLDAPGRVLFAPMHPNIEAMLNRSNGHDPAPSLNQHVYRQLLAMDVEFTVSVVGPPHRNGIWPHPRARFADNPTMGFEHAYTLVAEADTVVAAGTMGALAVAMGKPTVMLGQGDFSDYVDGQYVKAKHAGLYTAAARYPLDAEDEPLDWLLARACAGDAGAADWREAFAPDDGTAGAIRLLENLASEVLSEQAKYGDGHRGGAMNEEPDPKPEDEGGDEAEADAEAPQDATVEGATAQAGAVA